MNENSPIQVAAVVHRISNQGDGTIFITLMTPPTVDDQADGETFAIAQEEPKPVYDERLYRWRSNSNIPCIRLTQSGDPVRFSCSPNGDIDAESFINENLNHIKGINPLLNRTL